MNREDIIRMAHESHLDLYGLGTDYAKFADALERFAAIVASAEREACANLCKEMYLSGDMDTGLAEEAIRARGQA